MTKLFPNPCMIINSNLYRFGDPEMRTVEDLEKDTIAIFLRLRKMETEPAQIVQKQEPRVSELGRPCDDTPDEQA